MSETVYQVRGANYLKDKKKVIIFVHDIILSLSLLSMHYINNQQYVLFLLDLYVIDFIRFSFVRIHGNANGGDIRGGALHLQAGGVVAAPADSCGAPRLELPAERGPGQRVPDSQLHCE